MGPETIHDNDWWESHERFEALDMWTKAGQRGHFIHSKYFRDARLAFRRRINGSTEAETT